MAMCIVSMQLTFCQSALTPAPPSYTELIWHAKHMPNQDVQFCAPNACCAQMWHCCCRTEHGSARHALLPAQQCLAFLAAPPPIHLSVTLRLTIGLKKLVGIFCSGQCSQPAVLLPCDSGSRMSNRRCWRHCVLALPVTTGPSELAKVHNSCKVQTNCTWQWECFPSAKHVCAVLCAFAMRIVHAATMRNERSVYSCIDLLVVPRMLACDAVDIMSAYMDKSIEETEDSMYTAA